MSQLKLLFLDVETTGLDSETNAIVQISGIIEVDGHVYEEFDLKCRPFPQDSIDPAALKVQNRTLEEVNAFPDPVQIYKDLLAILDKYVDRYDKNDKFYMVGQNTKFDYDFMNAWFKKNGDKYFYSWIDYHLLDLMMLTTIFKVSGLLDVPNMKLETVAKKLDVPLKAHNSMNDITATRTIFHKYVDRLKTLNTINA